MLRVWHKLKKALSLKRKDHGSQNEIYHFNTPVIPPLPSPSPFSLSRLPNPTARSSKVTCVICLGSMKVGKGKAIFTGECSHSFHFSCIGENVKNGNLLCPICRCKWKDIPFQFATDVVTTERQVRVLSPVNASRPSPTVSRPPPRHVQFSDGGLSDIDVSVYDIGSDIQHSGRD
ncbi:E3 ubiquitin-protein ligase WAV3-like [Solanum pennellii]|uniref:E3 ubiquitin-protein ligase WAV3-like n=1 Tax=Solanum pennellii TaxID=28526 RepID=A0ABM1G1N1_SOLPN|nr:E3 ubiquitin-protein ligase WAV3-like [Solanum pennellii]